MANVPNVAKVTGKGFIRSSDRKDALINKLRELSVVLARFSSQEDLPSLEHVLRALVTPSVLQSNVPAVQMLAAVCFADLLRLTAPEPPYDAALTERVFDLIIAQLMAGGAPGGLGGPANERQKLHYRLLESLSVAHTPLILIEKAADPDRVSQLVALFDALFDLACADPDNKLEPHALGILISCVNSLETIPPKVLDVFLLRLLATDPSSRWSASLMTRCQEQLEAPVIEFVTRGILARQRTPSAIVDRGTQLELVYELITQCSAVFLSLVPQLQDALQDADFEVRNAYIDVFGRIFSRPQVAQQYKQLLLSYLGRFNDVEPTIRKSLADFSRDFLLKLPTFRRHITGYLISRCRDKDESVRRAVVIAVCDAAERDPSSVSVPLLAAVGGRTLDKKSSIRLEACEKLASLFRRHVGPYWRKQKSLPENSQKFTWIPKTLLKCSFVDADLTERIETLFVDTIFDSSRSMQERTHLLLGVYTSLEKDPETTAKFQRMFLTEKKSVQDIISNLMDLRAKSKTPGLNADQRKRMKQKSEAYAHLLVDKVTAAKGKDTAVEIVLTKFVGTRDNKIAKWFCELASPTTEFGALRASKDALLKALVSRSQASEYARRVVTRCALSAVSSDCVALMLGVAQGGRIPIIRASAIELLKLASSLFPAMFRSRAALESLATMVVGGDEDAEGEGVEGSRSFALKVLSRAVTTKDCLVLREVAPSLTELALSGPQTDAGRAISILIQIQGARTNDGDNKSDDDGDDEDAVDIRGILQTCLKSLQLDNASLASRLTCIREIVRHAPLLLSLDEAEALREFITGTLLVCDLPATLAQNSAMDSRGPASVEDDETCASDDESQSSKVSSQRSSRSSQRSKKAAKGKKGAVSRQKSKKPSMQALEQQNEKLLGAKVRGIEVLVAYLAALAARCQVPEAELTEASEYTRAEHKRIALYERFGKPIRALLFRVLISDGAITEARLHSRSVKDREAGAVVVAAAKGLLDLCHVRRFEQTLLPDEFQILAMVAHNDLKEVRQSFLLRLWEDLRASKLPERFAVILTLAASCREDSLKANMRHALAVLIARRRRQNALRSQVSQGEQHELSAFPEYDLVYLVYLLAHHPDFEDDARTNFPYILKFLDAYFDALMQGQRTNNFTLILQILNHIKASSDAHKDAEFRTAKRVNRCAELAQVLLKRRYQGKAWSDGDDVANLEIELPRDRYTAPARPAATPAGKKFHKNSPRSKLHEQQRRAASKKRKGSAKEEQGRRSKRKRSTSKQKDSEAGMFLGKKFNLPSDAEIRGFHHLQQSQASLSQHSRRSHLSLSQQSVATTITAASSSSQGAETKRASPAKDKKKRKSSALAPASPGSLGDASQERSQESDDDEGTDVEEQARSGAELEARQQASKRSAVAATSRRSQRGLKRRKPTATSRSRASSPPPSPHSAMAEDSDESNDKSAASDRRLAKAVPSSKRASKRSSATTAAPSRVASRVSRGAGRGRANTSVDEKENLAPATLSSAASMHSSPPPSSPRDSDARSSVADVSQSQESIASSSHGAARSSRTRSTHISRPSQARLAGNRRRGNASLSSQPDEPNSQESSAGAPSQQQDRPTRAALRRAPKTLSPGSGDETEEPSPVSASSQRRKRRAVPSKKVGAVDAPLNRSPEPAPKRKRKRRR